MACINLFFTRPLRSQTSWRRQPGQPQIRYGKNRGKPGHPQALGKLSDYNERRKQHAITGRILVKVINNIKKLDRLVMKKWER
jgi:hypothetical protein